MDIEHDEADWAAASWEASRRPARGGELPLALGAVVALAWMGLVIGLPFAAQGSEALLNLTVMQAGLWAAMAVAPALLFLFSGLAASEAARSRAEMRRLAILTLNNRAPSATQHAYARDFADLDPVVKSALTNLARLDAPALKQQLVDLAQVDTQMRDGAHTLAQSVGRQIRLMREAARLVEAEVEGAERRLGAQTEGLSAAAALVADRAAAVHSAAAQADGAAANLDSTLCRSLEALAQATSLTDAARQSAEQAALNASKTAGMLHDAGARAFTDFRRSQSIMTPPASANINTPLEPFADELEFGERMAGAGSARNIQPPSGGPRPRTLADLADLAETAGFRATEVLTTKDLDLIAEASRRGVDARRDAVRACAPGAVRSLSRTFRKDTAARRQAESLRAQRAGALAAPSAGARRNLACAYLLIDAALG